MQLGSCSSEKREVLCNSALEGEDADCDSGHLSTDVRIFLFLFSAMFVLV